MTVTLPAAPSQAAPGLVRCAISPGPPEDWFHFPSAEDLADALRQVPDWSSTRRDRRVGVDGSHVTLTHNLPGPVNVVTVGPGVVRLRRTDVERCEQSAARRRDREDREALLLGPETIAPKRGMVSAWSARSRSRLVEMIGRLDLASLLKPDSQPCMVTLTCPGDWLAVAPNPTAWRRAVERFWTSWAERYGAPAVIWKREFQRRGAPHLHIWTVVPDPDAGLFRRWITTTWSRCLRVATTSEDDALLTALTSVLSDAPAWHALLRGAVRARSDSELVRHLRAGTGLDFAQGQRARDPKRLAIYFLKESGAGEAKAYQNEPPAAWIECGEGVGRYWGVKGIDVLEVRFEVDERCYAQLGRVIGHLLHVYTPVARIPVERWTVDEQGQLIRVRHRRCRRRRKQRAGFVMVNDGAAFLRQLARYLRQLTQELD